MNKQPNISIRSITQSSLLGMQVNLALAIFYGAAFTLVAVPRASMQILATLPPTDGMLATLLANAVSIFILAMEFAAGLGLVAAVIGGLTMALVSLLARLFERRVTQQRNALIGLALSVLFAAGLHLLLSSLEGLPHAILFRSATSYLFWLGLPCLLYITTTTWFSGRVRIKDASQ